MLNPISTGSSSNLLRLDCDGNYGIVERNVMLPIGKAVDVLPLARRVKAVDYSNPGAPVTTHDLDSEAFKYIQAAACDEGPCQYGASFLLYERSTQRFVEFLCGTKAARREARKMAEYMRVTEAQVDFCRKYGLVGKPREMRPLTLRARQVGEAWIPDPYPCQLPFPHPAQSVIVEQITAFLTAGITSATPSSAPLVAKSSGRLRAADRAQQAS